MMLRLLRASSLAAAEAVGTAMQIKQQTEEIRERIARIDSTPSTLRLISRPILGRCSPPGPFAPAPRPYENGDPVGAYSATRSRLEAY